jgi:hypothetical protein
MNDNKHGGYEAFAEKWFKTRCAVEGQTAVHRAGEKFLPRLTDQTDNDYNGYKPAPHISTPQVARLMVLLAWYSAKR